MIVDAQEHDSVISCCIISHYDRSRFETKESCWDSIRIYQALTNPGLWKHLNSSAILKFRRRDLPPKPWYCASCEKGQNSSILWVDQSFGTEGLPIVRPLRRFQDNDVHSKLRVGGSFKAEELGEYEIEFDLYSAAQIDMY